MLSIKKINHVLTFVIVTAGLLLAASCKKDYQPPRTSPWQEKASGGVKDVAVIEMSEPDQTTCYGVLIDFGSDEFTFYHDLTITHNGGASWHKQTISELSDSYIVGVAATTPNTVHVFGYDSINFAGRVYKSNDGGSSWHLEGANTYKGQGSFLDDMRFFNPENGVLFGDPQNGYFEVYTTSNGGSTWSRVPSGKLPEPLPGEVGFSYLSDTYNNTIWEIVVTNDETGFPMSARLLQSDDKGSSWYVRNAALSFNDYDCSIKFRNKNVGMYKVHDVLYGTKDGGTTWHVINTIGTWFTFDFDNVPGKDGWWVSTGNGPRNPSSTNGFGSSISYDDGKHWVTIDTAVGHTCVDMTSPTHGYSGGISTGNGNDGVFTYSILPSQLPTDDKLWIER